MPIYEFLCQCGAHFTVPLHLRNHTPVQTCTCGNLAQQVITAPLLVKVAADVRYDSPIDGTHITNWHAREEDLKRNNCRPYDPAQKQDYERRIKEKESALDKSIDVSVEAAIEHMDGATRGRLASELDEQHLTAEPVRSTFGA